MRNWRRATGIGMVTAALLGPVVGFSASPTAAKPDPSFTTVASGFDNPRGLAVGEHGQIYVAEAGKGGPKCISGGPEGKICPGLTSAISVISRSGAHHRIVSGLISVSGAGGIAATGADGLAFREVGGLSTVMTDCPQRADQLPPGAVDPATLAAAKAELGQVIKVGSNGHFTTVAGVGSFDWNWSLTHTKLVPGQFPDCNPYGILAGSRGFWVVDAASNTLDRVASDGKIHVAAFIPNPRVSDSVPTCLARGRDGNVYIGELAGAGNRPGAADVWRFNVKNNALDPKPWATGLSAVTGCGFGPDGTFYATEYSTLGLDKAAPFTGAVVRVPAHSTSPIIVAAGLSFPNGFAATGHSLYVSNWSISPASPPPPSHLQPGAVVRINLP